MKNALNAKMKKHIIGQSKQEQEMNLKQNFLNVKSANMSGEIIVKDSIINNYFKVIVKHNFTKKN